jgi:hypothetical protein
MWKKVNLDGLFFKSHDGYSSIGQLVPLQTFLAQLLKTEIRDKIVCTRNCKYIPF